MNGASCSGEDLRELEDLKSLKRVKRFKRLFCDLAVVQLDVKLDSAIRSFTYCFYCSCINIPSTQPVWFAFEFLQKSLSDYTQFSILPFIETFLSLIKLLTFSRGEIFDSSNLR